MPAPFLTHGRRPVNPSSAAVVITCDSSRSALATVFLQELVARGDELDASVSVTGRKDLGTLEVGLVCTEPYEVADPDNRGVSLGDGEDVLDPSGARGA